MPVALFVGSGSECCGLELVGSCVIDWRSQLVHTFLARSCHCSLLQGLSDRELILSWQLRTSALMCSPISMLGVRSKLEGESACLSVLLLVGRCGLRFPS